MKRIVALLALILAPALSFAQTNVIQNEAGTSYAPNTGNINSNVAVDRALRLIVSLSSGTASATNPIKLEDSAAASGDAGISTLGVVNDSANTLAADGDYTWPALHASGVVQTNIWNSAIPAAIRPTSILKLEDNATASGDAGVAALARVKGDFNASAADGDYGHINVDLDGRLAVNPWGADPSESGQACGTATATTADVAIKAAVASTRIYYGSVTCKNTSATVATPIDFKDGATVVGVGAVEQTIGVSAGKFSAVFNPPVRGTVNTAVNFATNVATTSVTCCISWFTSGN